MIDRSTLLSRSDRLVQKACVPEPRQALPRPALDRPLDLEIGCGVGWHPIRYISKNPERQLLAVERTRQKFARFTQRLTGNSAALESTSLFPIHDDAVRVLVHAPDAWRFSRVMLLYPNPERKDPRRRWPRSPARHLIAERLLEGVGTIISATNDSSLAEDFEFWFATLAASRGLAVSTHCVRRKIQKGDIILGLEVPRTHFEKKYLERGETCWHLAFTLKARGRPD